MDTIFEKVSIQHQRLSAVPYRYLLLTIVLAILELAKSSLVASNSFSAFSTRRRLGSIFQCIICSPYDAHLLTALQSETSQTLRDGLLTKQLLKLTRCANASIAAVLVYVLLTFFR